MGYVHINQLLCCSINIASSGMSAAERTSSCQQPGGRDVSTLYAEMDRLLQKPSRVNPETLEFLQPYLGLESLDGRALFEPEVARGASSCAEKLCQRAKEVAAEAVAMAQTAGVGGGEGARAGL